MEMNELPEGVQRKLNDYRRSVEEAYEAEFKVVDSKLSGAKTVTRDQLADLASDAVLCLAEVMRDGEKDGDRINAAKYVLDKVLGKDAVLDPDDPMSEMIKKLTANKSE